MPARTTTSKATKAKQAQAAKGSKNSGSGRRRAPSDDEQEEEQEEEQGEEEEQEDATAGGAVAIDSDDDKDDGEEEGMTLMASTLPQVNATAKNAARILGKKECHRCAHDLVRLALATEYKRGALKRVEIIEKIIGKEHARAFPFILRMACKHLKKTFGYELVELRARGTENEQLKALSMGNSQGNPPQAEKEGVEEANGTQKQKKKRKRNGEEGEEGEETVPKSKTATSTGSGTSSYILRSLLPPVLLASLSAPDDTLSSVMNPDGETTDANGDELMKDSEGALVDWKRSDGQLGGMGLLSVVLSLIMVSGRSISNNQLLACLRRLGLDRKAFLPPDLQPDAQPYDPSRRSSMAQTQSTQSASSTSFGGIGSGGVSGGPLTLDNYLSLLVRQGYLERVKDSINLTQAQGAGGGRSQSGRGRRSGAGEEDGGDNVEWKWGSRAELEIGEKALVGFMGEILREDDDDEDLDDDEDEEDRTQRGSDRRKSQSTQRNRVSREEKLQKKRQERESKLNRDIERAAGSQLIV